MTERFLYGVKFVGFEGLPEFVLCSDCIGPLLDQIGGWKNIDLGKVYPLIGENNYSICAVCSRSITAERRGGADRREYVYEFYIPERRATDRRKSDETF